VRDDREKSESPNHDESNPKDDWPGKVIRFLGRCGVEAEHGAVERVFRDVPFCFILACRRCGIEGRRAGLGGVARGDGTEHRIGMFQNVS
jgi:hypothetical protein